MPFKSILAAILAFSSLLTFALDVTDRDAQLRAALKSINSYGSTWTEKGTRSFYYQMDGALVAILGAGAAGVTGVLYTKAHEIYSTAEEVTKFKTLVQTHGPRVALGVLGMLVIDKVVYESLASSDRHDAESLRAASARNVDVYRAEMAHFLSLSPQEQFLIAKRDEKFTDDLITLGQSYAKK